MRKLKFDLDVNTNALLCPNPREWYAGVYIQENVANNFRTIPGVKHSTKVSSILFDDVLKSAGCSWDPTDTTLDAEDIEVCSLDSMTQLCQFDVESSFVSERMVSGDTNWTEAEFMAHYFETLQNTIVEEIQIIRWNGDTSLSSGIKSLCDGYIKQILDESSAAVDATGSETDITINNIVDLLGNLVASLPEEVVQNFSSVRIYMSASNALKYQIATLGLNHNTNYTGTLPLSFANFEIAVQPGMDDNVIVAGRKEQFAYAFDGEGDSKAVKAVNMTDTTAEPILRTRVGLKIGFKVLDNANGVAYINV